MGWLGHSESRTMRQDPYSERPKPWLIIWAICLLGAVISEYAWSYCEPRRLKGAEYIVLPNKIEKKWVRVFCHGSMVEPLTLVFKCILNHKEVIRNTKGCYCYRTIKGTTRLSQHAYGLAVDIDVGLTQNPTVVKCFESNGFIWGGRWPKPDFHHYELKRKK